MRHLSDIVLNQEASLLGPDETVFEATMHLQRTRAGSVLIVDANAKLVGIFTDHDALHRVIATGRDPSTTRLVDVMTKTPCAMPPDSSAIEALRIMWDGGFHHLPVLDVDHILGVVSRDDFKDSENECLDKERELWEHMR